MKNWTKRSTLKVLAAAFAAAALPLHLAHADVRPFPPNALRGKMTPGYYPDLTIDGKKRQLSPSGRIFNQDNMIEMPASLRGSDIVVNYTVDAMGYIDRVWILTRDEAALTLPTTPPAVVTPPKPVEAPPDPRPRNPPPATPASAATMSVSDSKPE
jgi:hypothetical protein